MNIKEVLKDYKIEVNKGRVLNKNQRLALEIIEYCKIKDKKWIGMWFRACKNNCAFVEDKFRLFKETGKTNGEYLFRMIFKKQ